MNESSNKASIKSVRDLFLTHTLVEDPETEEIRFEVNSVIKDLEDHQMLALIRKGNGRASSQLKNSVYHEALDLMQQLTTADTENGQKLPQTKESLLKSHMNENAQEYAQIKQSIIIKDSKRPANEIIRKNSTIVASPSV